MKYKNTKTGFEFETSDEIVGEDWVKLSPSSKSSKVAPVQPQEDKPEYKRTRKYE